MQYKTDFLASSLATALIMGIDYLMLAAILLKFKDIRGWTIDEVGILYGISSISFSLFRLVASELHNFDKYMVEGEFDQLLIRPLSPLTLLLSRHIDLSRLGGIAQGFLILGYSLSHLPGGPGMSVRVIAYLPVSILSGFLIGLTLSLTTATSPFGPNGSGTSSRLQSTLRLTRPIFPCLSTRSGSRRSSFPSFLSPS